MASITLPFRPQPFGSGPRQSRLSSRALLVTAAFFAALASAGIAVWAQVAGDRGIPPVASSSDITVGGIEVDVEADTAEEAREEAWRQAQRLAWERIDGPSISDGQLETLVSAVVIERERIAPGRYIARLGIIFDRTRASGYLGGSAQQRPSAPMLLLPVTVSGGTYTLYERRNLWQRAWAEFQPGRSRINYVRPVGSGGDSLLLTYGQAGRRSRLWWNNILDQFGAADVLVPIAQLRYQYPGGPIEGTFVARHGPDSDYLGGFTLSADGPEALPAMLEQAVERFDRLFQQALAEGVLRPDPTLNMAGTREIDPAIQRLLDVGRAIEARDAAITAGLNEAEVTAAPDQAPSQPQPQPQAVASFSVQFASPDAASFDGALQAVRGTPGVRSLAVTSTAIGGTSVMSVGYAGSLDQLAQALRARGFAVRQGQGALSISR